jgi:hypothetical protein
VTALAADQGQALRLLANSQRTESIMLAHGFTISMLDGLVGAGLAIAESEFVFAGQRTVKVVRMRMTDAGRRALRFDSQLRDALGERDERLCGYDARPTGEGAMKSLLRWLIGLYVAIAVITMGFQVYYRYPDCAPAVACGVSLSKGIVWSAIWPLYWAIQWDWLK